MTIHHFQETLKNLINTAEIMIKSSKKGKPEENTKDKLITPLLDALNYTVDYRTPEGSIRSLFGTTTWVDYLLLPEKKQHPKLMFEVKSLWDKNIWENNEKQVLNYLRDYSLDIGTEKPVLWIILSNFREWHILRLHDKKPFWSFTIDDLKNDPDLVNKFYTYLNRDSLKLDRIDAFYTEKTREELGTKFLADLKIWRLILANGIKKSQPNLSLEKIREAAQVILNRFLLIRLLETFSREMPFNYLGRVYYNWQQTFADLPFIEDLRRAFHHTWVGYNTELFQLSWIDDLMIEVEYLESIIVINTTPPEGILYAITGSLTNYRSIYNYDFTTLTQDILGTAYEQFLAHQLILEDGIIKILDNQETRKQEGIFYTPDYIVKRIVYQTLQPLIKPKIEDSIALLQQGEFKQASQIANSVFDITILDPACGSGSFLLGTFDYLLTEIKRYNLACDEVQIPEIKDIFSQNFPEKITNLEEQIVVKMLHGVDLDHQAVLLAKLSLWTKLLRSRPGEYGRKSGSIYSHLPALTLNIRVGNSLIFSPYNFTLIEDKLEVVSNLANTARDINKTEIERNKAVIDLQIKVTEINQQINPLLYGFFASDESIKSVIKSVKKREANQEDILLIREYLTENKTSRKLTENWTDNQLEKVKSELLTLETTQGEIIIKQPFNWQVEFTHIFDVKLPEMQRGFSAIVGNPPYFNIDATFGRGALELKWLKYAYNDIYTDKTDILFYFFRQGFNLLKENGRLSYIVSRAFLQGDKSENLRTFLTNHTIIENIIDFLGHRVFNAGIATCIFSYIKPTQSSQKNEDKQNIITIDNVIDFQKVKSILMAENPLTNFPDNAVLTVNIEQKSLSPSRWLISPYNPMFSIIDSHGIKLKNLEYGKFMKGIDTGLDAVFEGKFKDIFPDTFLCSRVPISGIYPFGYELENNQIIYFTRDTLWEDLPSSLQQYLTKNKELLENRKSYQSGGYEWYHLHRARVGLFSPKIFFPRRANSNKFVVDEKGNLGFKSDVAGYILNSEFNVDILYFICALLNSKVLEFRYRALGGLGKLTGKDMFEYFENQVGDLPIPLLDDLENNNDYQELVKLSKEAHQIWQYRYQIISTYNHKANSISYQEISLNEYHKLTGDYALDIEWESNNPHQEGYLLKLAIKPTLEGYIILGEMTEDDDWKEGDRIWVEIAKVKVKIPHLRRYLLAKLIYLTEFDASFRGKKKLSQGKDNLVKTVFKVLKVNCYDVDRFSNLRVLELIEKRVEEKVGKSDLENVLIRQEEVLNHIDNIAYKLYGVEEYREIITQELINTR